jgi:integrase
VKFLLDALNEIFLMKKVVAIFGVAGGCRCNELYNLKMQDVDHKNNIIVVRINYFDKKQCAKKIRNNKWGRLKKLANISCRIHASSISMNVADAQGRRKGRATRAPARGAEFKGRQKVKSCF